MKNWKPIRWQEGMFLRPHHMQRAELYHETMRSAGFRVVEPQGWGLSYLELDEEPLANFTLSVKQLRAVLDDGAVINVPENATLPSRSFEAMMTDVGKPLDVTIGVRRREDGVPQTLPAGQGAGMSRFSPDEEDVFDADAGQHPVPIEFLRYNVRFFLGDEPTDGYETLPLLRLVRTGDAARPVGFQRGFVPPCLVVAASPVLHDIARGAVENANTVLREIGSSRGGNNPEPLILFQALAGAVPVLRDMVHDGRVHPRWVYRELARLAGCLFFRDPDRGYPDQVPAYSHRNLGPVFEELAGLISRLSKLAIEKNWERVPMQREKDLFVTALPEGASAPGVKQYLEVKAAVTAPGDVKNLIKAAITSSPERISTLKTFRMLGVSTEHLPGPPPQLPPGQTAEYHRLKIESGEEWEKFVVPSGKLSVSILNAPQDLELSLILVYPR